MVDLVGIADRLYDFCTVNLESFRTLSLRSPIENVSNRLPHRGNTGEATGEGK
jgi:hypothetical protein